MPDGRCPNCLDMAFAPDVDKLPEKDIKHESAPVALETITSSSTPTADHDLDVKRRLIQYHDEQNFETNHRVNTNKNPDPTTRKAFEGADLHRTGEKQREEAVNRYRRVIAEMDARERTALSAGNGHTLVGQQTEEETAPPIPETIHRVNTNKEIRWDGKITWKDVAFALCYAVACYLIFDCWLSPSTDASKMIDILWVIRHMSYWVFLAAVLGAIGLLLGNGFAFIFSKNNAEHFRFTRNVVAVMIMVLETGAMQWNKGLALKDEPLNNMYIMDSSDVSKPKTNWGSVAFTGEVVEPEKDWGKIALNVSESSVDYQEYASMQVKTSQWTVDEAADFVRGFPSMKASIETEKKMFSDAAQSVAKNIQPVEIAEMRKAQGEWNDEDVERFYRYRAQASDDPELARASYEKRVEVLKKSMDQMMGDNVVREFRRKEVEPNSGQFEIDMIINEMLKGVQDANDDQADNPYIQRTKCYRDGNNNGIVNEIVYCERAPLPAGGIDIGKAKRDACQACKTGDESAAMRVALGRGIYFKVKYFNYRNELLAEFVVDRNSFGY